MENARDHLEPSDETQLIQPDQLAKALSHPLRRAILNRLVGGPESPTTLARATHRSVSDVAYHVRVLDRECRVLEAVDTGLQRSANQRFRRLKSPMRFASLGLERLPSAFQHGVLAFLLEQFVSLASEAIESGSIGKRDGATLSLRPSRFDADGWAQANSVLRAADEEIEMIEGESRERLKAAGHNGVIHAVFGSALFEAAAPSNLPPGQPPPDASG